MDDMLSRVLDKHEKSQSDAATALGVPLQTLNNWTIRGISREGKLLVWLALNSPRVLARWLKERGNGA